VEVPNKGIQVRKLESAFRIRSVLARFPAIQKIDADAYLSKPVDLEELLGCVTQFCRPQAATQPTKMAEVPNERTK